MNVWISPAHENVHGPCSNTTPDFSITHISCPVRFDSQQPVYIHSAFSISTLHRRYRKDSQAITRKLESSHRLVLSVLHDRVLQARLIHTN